MHNENRSRQTQTSANAVTNLNVQDTAGITLAQSSGNTIFSTDQGALRVSESIALDSIAAGAENVRSSLVFARDASESALSFGTDSLDFADRSAGRSFDFAGQALDVISDSTRASLNFADATSEREVDFARGIFGDALETVTGVLSEGQAQLGNTVTNLNAIARQQTTSEAERIQDIAGQALKIGAVMVGLVALAFVSTRMRA